MLGRVGSLEKFVVKVVRKGYKQVHIKDTCFYDLEISSEDGRLKCSERYRDTLQYPIGIRTSRDYREWVRERKEDVVKRVNRLFENSGVRMQGLPSWQDELEAQIRADLKS